MLGVDNSNNSVATLTSLDSIDGGKGINTLNLVDASPAAHLQALTLPSDVTIENVQNINLATTGNAGDVANGNALDVSGINGLTNLNVHSANNAGDWIKAAATTNVTDTTAGASEVDGGNNVTIDANGAITVSGAAGAVNVTDHAGAPGGVAAADIISVQGGTTVNVTATAASNDSVEIGTAPSLNAAGTALDDASTAAEPTGNVTVNESTTNSHGVTSFGNGAATIYTNGANVVSLTGTAGGTITDVQTTANNAGVAFGTSTLASVNLDGVNGSTTITSDALTNLTIQDNDNVVGSSGNVTTVDNSNDHALSLTVGANLVTGTGANAPTTEYANVVDGTATSVSVATTGTVAADVTLSAAEATSVAFNNAADVTLEASSLAKVATITASGSGALDLGNVSGLADLTSIDASAAAGDVSAVIGADQAFHGGAGNDVVTISSLPTEALDGGAGNNELIVDGGPIAGLNKVEANFQTMGLGANATAATYNGSAFSSFALEGDVNASIIGSISATNVTLTDHATNNFVSNTPAGGITMSFANNNDALTVNLGADNATAANATNVHLDVTTQWANAPASATQGGVSSLTINSAGVTDAQGAGANNEFNLTDANLQSIKITGDSDLSASVTGSHVTSIDASAATGAVDVTAVGVSSSGVTITGGAGSLTAEGGAGSDTINVGTGGGEIIGSAGGDAINIASGATHATELSYGDATSTLDAFDTVNGFVNYATAPHGAAGGLSDTIHFSGTGTTAQLADVATSTQATVSIYYIAKGGMLTFENSAGTAATFNLTAEITAAEAAVDGHGAGTTAAFELGGNTFVVHAGGTLGATQDTVIELVGVHGITSIDGTAGAHNITLA